MTLKLRLFAVRWLICIFFLTALSSVARAQTVALPGTIQAEDFNQGSAGVAYVDSTPGNYGGQYRATDVDIEATSDTGGGHNLGWTVAGEWLAYTVSVATAGSYDIEVRVASGGTGGRFHIEVNGVDKTGPLTIPSTGGWQTWTTIRRNGVALTAGQQTWRIVMDSNGATSSVGNINYVRVSGPVGAGPTPTPYTGTPAPLPGTVQAEDFDNGGEGVGYHDLSVGNDGGQYRSAGVDIEFTTDTGGGYNVSSIQAGEWLSYTVNVGSAGTYDIEARVASSGPGGTFHIEINGVDRTGPFTIPNSGGWQAWTTIRKTGLSLGAGQQVWRVVMDTNGPNGSIGNLNFIRASASAGGSGSTPVTGTPAPLPGLVQFEDFDNGGEGVAYHDSSAGNFGGLYRSTDVDIQATSDTGGGHNIGWTVAGEWLAYTVNVSTAGTYDIEARVASSGAGGTFHIEVNGVDRTGPFTVPSTGGAQTWTTIRKTGLTLGAGSQVWRVVMDTNGPAGSVGNFNYIRVVAAGGTPPPPPPGTPTTPLPGTLQAEDFDNGGEGTAYHDTSAGNYGGAYRSTDVDIQPTSDTGGGYNLGWTAAGEWLAYSVNVGAAGTYDIEVRVASAGNGGTFHIEVNGVDRTGPFTVPSTGSWQTWTTIRKTGLSLSAGPQVFRLVMDANGATGSVGDINYIRVVGNTTTPNQPPTASLTAPANGATYTAPATITMNATASDSDGTVARVEFYGGSQLVGTDTAGPYSATWNNVPAGTYSLRAIAYDNTGASTTTGTVSVTVGAAPPPGTPSTPLPGTLQIEDFDNGGEGVAYHDTTGGNYGGAYRSTDVDIQPTADTGGGYNIGWTAPGEWLAYSVNVTASGLYDIEVRVASAGNGGTFHIELNGVDRTGPLVVPSTGSWQTWTTIRKTGVNLSAGPQVLRVVMDTNGATGSVGDLNYIRVVSSGATSNQPPTVALTAPSNGATYTAPASITMNASASDSDGTIARVEFYAGSQLVGTDTVGPYSATWNNVPAGTYSLRAIAYDDDNASTSSATVSVTVGNAPPPPAPTPTTLLFMASADHALVTSYSVALYRAGDPVTATPVATRNLGKPTPVNDEISVDISDIVNPLPAGSYYAVVSATSSGGTAASTPSATFTK